ncbi:hypothetical protein MNBD_GAMMA15-1812 [hydrothermal vent metagenome]|uniref:histidine kinase n=1 Tax=hydrothermal vent metagenome TaxID=652676 RepID=A0A3B0YJ57_9ZZZZ
MKILDKRIFLLLASIGVGVSLLISAIAFNYELEKENQRFNHQAQTVFKEIKMAMDNLKNIDNDLASLFYTLEDIDESEFKLFTDSIIGRTPSVNLIFYMPHIERKNQEKISRQLQGQGYTGFEFRTFPENQYQPSPFQNDLFPIKYINPFSVMNSRWIGMDILTFSQVQSAVIQSTEYPKTLILSAGSENENYLYAFRALHYGRDMPDERDLNIDGVFGVLGYRIDMSRVISEASISPGSSIHVLLGETHLLGENITKDRTLLSGYVEDKTSIEFGGGVLYLSLQKSIDYLQMNIAMPAFTLIIGLLLTFLITYVTWSNAEHSRFLLHQNTTIEHEVAQKTAQLDRQSGILKKAYKEQQLVINELESFSYSVSHDLRAPLRAIDGYSQVLLDDYSDRLDDTASNYLQRVRSNAQHMGALIDALLDLSRVSRRTLNPEKTSLSKHATKIFCELKESSQSDKEYETIVGEDIIVTGDSHLLYVVLENLLSNSWKYASKSDNPIIEFNRTEIEGREVFFVRDNGVGFNMSYANKLFIPFQRLHGSEFAGDGIGLATVKRIIDRHHGSIWASSELDVGASFFFTLNEDKPGEFVIT